MTEAYRRWKKILEENPPLSERLKAPEPPTPETSGMAIASLILGILSCFVGPFTGIPAIILGTLGMRKIYDSKGAIAGRGLAIAGLVLGYVSTILTIFTIVYVAVVVPATLTAVKEELSALLGRETQNVPQLIRVPFPPPPRPIRKPSPIKVPIKTDFSVDITRNEAAVIKVLHELLAGEEAHYRTNGRYVSSTKALGFESFSGNTFSGYRFTFQALSSAFRIIAEPLVPGQTGMRCFYADESGIIRASEAGKASKESPPLSLAETLRNR